MASNASSSTSTSSTLESTLPPAPGASAPAPLLPNAIEAIDPTPPIVQAQSRVSVDADAPERRPQAGPLPRKRGEIGFRESLLAQNEENSDSIELASLPARHPADRDQQTNTAGSNSSPGSGSNSSPSPANNSSSASLSASETSSMRKSRKAKLFSLLNPAPRLSKTKFRGVALSTILRLIFQLALLGGTLAAWIIITKRLGESGSSLIGMSQDSSPTLSGSSSIFVHVTFGIAVLGQLLFLERCVYFIRAQRYAFLHPGEVLPLHREGRGVMPGMGFAPWNRTPLPTYAAALQQSGVGTGDVEDNAIAIPPPPAYGNTRGSTLILRGFLRNSLREAIGRESIEESDEGQHQRPMSHLSTSSRPARPVSYRSQDEEWEERQNAERALRLAETLERLEDSSNSNNNGSSSISRTIA